MSIVIALIDRITDTLYFYGDKRLTSRLTNGEETYSDDFTKVFKLKEDLFIGIAGDADIGKYMVNNILNGGLLLKNTDFIIDFLSKQKAPLSDNQKLIVIIAGKNDSGYLFVWIRDFNGNPLYTATNETDGHILRIACNSEYNSDVNARYLMKTYVDLTSDHKNSIINTIKAVSQEDITVSPTFDGFIYCKN